MEFIVMRPIGSATGVVCWNCSRPIDTDDVPSAARYLYRGDQPSIAIVEDWYRCSCGAFQNQRRTSEIIVEVFGKRPPAS